MSGRSTDILACRTSPDLQLEPVQEAFFFQAADELLAVGSVDINPELDRRLADHFGGLMTE